MNSSFSHEVWERMRIQLIPFFNGELRIILPEMWSDQYEVWFKAIEAKSFRELLRYNSSDLESILNEANVLVLFILVDESPEGVILGYPVKRVKGNTFYLDTFAIRTKGKGIGRIVLDSLIHWARLNEFSAIELDTEAENEVGIPLQSFYESFGFVVQNIETDGNITMNLML